MADDRDLDPTEPASQRRLEQARAQGQLPRSAEFSNFLALLAGVGALMILTPSLSEQFLKLFQQAISIDRAAIFDPAVLTARLGSAALEMLMALLPVLLILLAVPVLAAVLIGGWVVVPHTMAPDLSRNNPLTGFLRLFSLEHGFDFLKNVLKVTLLGGGLFALLWVNGGALGALVTDSGVSSSHAIGGWLGRGLLIIAATLLLVAFVDTLFKIWYYRRALRMTRSEVLQEYRETEGDPAVKAQVRARQQQRLSARGIKREGESA